MFRRTLELELAAARERVGRLGEGVLVGSVGFALGADLDRLFVCGLAEGVFPSAPRDDPLLSDLERGVLAGELPLRADRTAADHRGAAGGARGDDRRPCARFPRGDLRRSTEHVPSRYLLDTVEALSGARDLDTRASVVHGDRFVQSTASRAWPFPAHRARARPPDRARRRTADGDRLPARPRSCSRRAAARSSRGSTATSARSRPRSREVGPASPDVVVSPTAPRSVGALPARLLHAVRARHRPRRTARGHRRAAPDRSRLDRARGARPVRRRGRHDRRDANACTTSPTRCATSSPSAGSRAGACSGCASSGVIHDALDAWLEADARLPGRVRPAYGRNRAPLRTDPCRRFPIRAHVAVPRGDRPGRRGRRRPAVRVRLQDRASRTRRSTRTIRSKAGTRLQLPVYALAARGSPARRPTRPSRRTTGSSAAARTAWIGYRSTRRRRERFDATLQAIVDGIEARLLPGPAGRTRAPVLHRLRVLRPRSPRHRRSLARLDPQGASAGARGLRRADGCDRVTDLQPSLFDPVSRDDAARIAIRSELADTLFVEAGAGTGKTAALVDRIVGAGRDPGIADARDRGDHVHREGGGRAARPRAGRAREASGLTTTARVRSTSSTRPRSARCTRSRSASSPSSRSRPGSRRASRSATRSRPRSRSMRVGERFVDQMLDAPEYQAAVVLGSRPACGSSSCARSPRRSPTTGTCSTVCPRRPSSRTSRSTVGSSSSRDCARNATSASTPTTGWPVASTSSRRIADRLRNARDTADRIELLRREKPSFKVGNVGRKGSWRCDLSDAARAHRRAGRTAPGSAARSVERGDPALLRRPGRVHA